MSRAEAMPAKNTNALALCSWSGPLGTTATIEASPGPDGDAVGGGCRCSSVANAQSSAKVCANSPTAGPRNIRWVS